MTEGISGGAERTSGSDGPAKQRHPVRKALLIGGPIVILAAAYVGLAATQSGTVERGTTVAGQQVGGLSPAAARAKVDGAVAKLVGTPVTVNADGHLLTLKPASSGLSIDSAHALDGLSGFSLNPSTVWHRLAGDGPHRKVTPVVDRARLLQAVTAVSSGLEGAPKDGTVKFVDGKVVTTAAEKGRGIDQSAVTAQIASAWPGTTSFKAPVTHRAPTISDAEVQRYVTGFADPAMSGPVTVKVDGKTTSIPVRTISGLLSTTSDGTKLKPNVDTAALTKLLDQQAGALTTPAVEPKLRYVGGNPTVVAGHNGTAPDTKGADQLLLAALTAPDRTMSLPTRTVKPTTTVAELKKTKIGDQLISQFVSNFPTGPENAARTHNISVGLSKINGMVVAPGETFSLLNSLRPFDAAHGYVDAPVLVGGKDQPGMGGGISQVSTTLYNATFFAGVKEVEHTAHSYWIPRYPMGREATMWDPTIDNKWTNDTGHPIRIWAGIEGHASVIRLYGVKTFTVSSTTSNKFNFVPPGPPKHLSVASCIPQDAMDGFSVTVTRVVKNLSGAVVKNESLTTHYTPAVQVTCN